MPDCPHSNKLLTRRVIAGGRVQYVEQCTDCGASMNQPVAHWKVRQAFGESEPPAFDQSIVDRYDAKRAEEADAADVARRAEWFAGYDEYLASAAWKQRRQRVLKRAGGICEGCGCLPATEVHHLTYEHVRQEFLFELVALCHGCHERIHADK